MILYVHGFASSGRGMKARIFRRWAERTGIAFCAPSLSFVPDLALQTLREIILSRPAGEKIGVIGSSLGGFYALRLSVDLDVKAVLINGLLYPRELGRRLFGEQRIYGEGSRFIWEERHVQQLAAMECRPEQVDPARVLAFAKEGDRDVDCNQTRRMLPPASYRIDPGGDHGFADIGEKMAEIKPFLEV
ncbi:MAG: YqiA/YcfP family alpha/beta fold hydrolase [Fibrobacterota bacterium]